MKLRLNSQLVTTVAFRYPEIWLTMIRALLLTALAMLPTVVKLPKFLTSHSFFKFLHLAPWILVCGFKFLRNILMHVIVIRQVGQFNDATGLIMALAIYCIFLIKASEMMLHWIAIVHLTTEGYILDVRTEL
nr:uncharacterized protein LOC108076270 [Drosophila kikkawai]